MDINNQMDLKEIYRKFSLTAEEYIWSKLAVTLLGHKTSLSILMMVEVMQSLFADYSGSFLKLNIIIFETHKIHKWKSTPEQTVKKEIKKIWNKCLIINESNFII